MSFIGKVTRKEYDTGVMLRAKIVTPSKKKSITQDFKVRVKRSGLSDYERCVMDSAEVREKLMTQNNLNAIDHDIAFISQGSHGCTITYTIEDVNSPLLSDYLSPSGQLTGRPKFGEDAAAGYVTIKVSYGMESIETRISVIISQYNAGDIIMSNDIFDHKIIWNAIKGQNESYENNGHKSIQYPLNLIPTSDAFPVAIKKQLGLMTSTPVQFTWSVEDQLVNAVVTQPRIEVSGTTGTIFRPAYKDAITMVNTSPEAKIVSLGATDRVIQMEGLILSCTLKLSDRERTIQFLCGTRSKFLTNEEVLEELSQMMNIAKQDGGAYSYADTVAAAGNNTISVVGETKLGIPFAGTGTAWAISSLGLNAGDVVFYAESKVREFNNIVNMYDNAQAGNLLNMIDFNPSSASFVIDATTFLEPRGLLTIDGSKLEGLTNETLKKFTMETTIKVSAYSKDGTVVGGKNPGQNSANLYSNFTLQAVS